MSPFFSALRQSELATSSSLGELSIEAGLIREDQFGTLEVGFMHSSILSVQSILKNIKYNRNACTVCKGMNLGLLSELTASHF